MIVLIYQYFESLGITISQWDLWSSFMFVVTYVLFILSLIWNWELKRQVRKAVKQLHQAKKELEVSNNSLEKQLEERIKGIKEQEENFKELFEISASPIAVIDATTGDYLKCNAVWMKLEGLCDSKDSRNTLDNQMSPKYQPDSRLSVDVVKESLAKINEYGHYQFEYTILNEAKEEAEYIASGSKATYNGKDAFFIILQDISLQKKQARKIYQANKRAQQAMDISNSGSWYLDKDKGFQYIFCDDRLMRIFGINKKEGKNYIDADEFLSNIMETNSEKSNQLIDGLNSYIENNNNKEKFDQTYQIFNKITNEKVWIRAIATIERSRDGEAIIINGVSQDITKIKNYELQLAKSKKELQKLFYNMPIGFAEHEMIYDENDRAIDYKYTATNPAFHEMTGMDKDNTVMNTIKNIDPNIDDFWIQNYDNVARNGDTITFDQFYSKPQKHFRIFSFSNRKGHFAVLFYDITKEKTKEKELFEANRLVNQAMDISTSGAWYIDRINYPDRFFCDDRMLKMLGLDNNNGKKYVLFEDFFKNLMETNPERTKNFMAKVERFYDHEFSVNRYDDDYQTYNYKTKKKIWLKIMATTERSKDGKATMIVGVSQDITEIKNYEMKLQHMNKSLKISLNLAKSGFFSLELGLNPRQFFFSQELLEISGLTSKKNGSYYPLNAWIENIEKTNPKIAEKALLDIKDLRHSTNLKNEKTVIFQFTRPDNSEKVWFEGTANLIRNENNRVTSMEGVIQDITEKIEYETKLMEASKREREANLAKSTFLANMSHEIRTPMNAIIGFSEILSKRLEKETDLKYLNTIKSSGKTLLDLINNILDLSKIESGKMLLVNNPLKISTLLIQLKSLFDLKADNKNLIFTIITTPDVPKYISIDELKLQQIFINLLSNAFKFTENGEIKVEFDATNNTNKNKTDLIITVSDTGIGISKEKQEAVFEEFVQEDSSTTRLYGGTGLGLNITKRIVELFNGKLSLESKVGMGTKFTITLPNVDVISNHVKTKKISKNASKKCTAKQKHIMIIDDIENNRELLKEQLKSLGFNASSVGSGKEALEIVETINPDLILLDLTMPEMDGYTVAKNLKANPHTTNIPIIASTASAFSYTEQETKKRGFSGYLKKPILLNDLCILLQKYFNDEYIDCDSDNLIESPLILKEQLKPILSKLKPFAIKIKEEKSSSAKKELADEMIILGKEIKQTSIVKYGQELKQNIKTFDIEQTEQMINKILNMLED